MAYPGNYYGSSYYGPGYTPVNWSNRDLDYAANGNFWNGYYGSPGYGYAGYGLRDRIPSRGYVPGAVPGGTSSYGFPEDFGQPDRDQGAGSFAGRGPRNYRRSDERIEEDVNEELTRHGELDATDIEVTAKDGEVTLTGSVDSRRDKRLAEDIAASCSGVKDVHNHLTRAHHPEAQRPADREVTRAAASEHTGARAAQPGASPDIRAGGPSGSRTSTAKHDRKSPPQRSNSR